MITTTAGVRGTAEWLLARIDPAVELAIRRQLRVLERATSAASVVLAVRTTSGTRAEVIAYAGDRHTLPRTVAPLETSLPALVDLRTLHGDVETAVVHGVVVGRGIETPILVVMAPHLGSAEQWMRLVEETSEALEEILVAAVCPPPREATLRSARRGRPGAST
jgi:hypothetical protein